MDSSRTQTVDEYIKNYPKEVQEILEKLRKIAKEIVPEAEETISYGIPTIKLNGKYVIYFAAFAKHIGVYPILKAEDSLLKEIAPFVKGKGTLQFPLDKPFPYDLFKKLVKSNLKQNLERTKKRNK